MKNIKNFWDSWEKALLKANQFGLNEVNLEFNPKKLERLIKKVKGVN